MQEIRISRLQAYLHALLIHPRRIIIFGIDQKWKIFQRCGSVLPNWNNWCDHPSSWKRYCFSGPQTWKYYGRFPRISETFVVDWCFDIGIIFHNLNSKLIKLKANGRKARKYHSLNPFVAHAGHWFEQISISIPKSLDIRIFFQLGFDPFSQIQALDAEFSFPFLFTSISLPMLLLFLLNFNFFFLFLPEVSRDFPSLAPKNIWVFFQFSIRFSPHKLPLGFSSTGQDEFGFQKREC